MTLCSPRTGAPQTCDVEDIVVQNYLEELRQMVPELRQGGCLDPFFPTLAADPRRPVPRTQEGKKPPRVLHIFSISIVESFDQLLFLRPRPDDD